MSIWTHISGSIDLEKYPYVRHNKKRKLFLPFKEEQVSLDVPTVSSYDGKKAGLHFNVNVTSYPVIKSVVKKNINLIPSGESEVIEYFLNKTKGHRSSCSNFICSDDKAQFQKLVMNLYREKLWPNAKWSDYQKQLNVKLDFVNHQQNTILTITDDVRDCTALDMLKGLLNFIKALSDNDIDFNNGYLYWEDELGAKCSIDFCHDCSIIYVEYEDKEKATLSVNEDFVEDEDGFLCSYKETKVSKNWTKVTGIPADLFSNK